MRNKRLNYGNKVKEKQRFWLVLLSACKTIYLTKLAQHRLILHIKTYKSHPVNKHNYYYKTTVHILKKINQETILYRTLDVLGQYLSHPLITCKDSINDITHQANVMTHNSKHEKEKLFARMLLAGVSERLVVSTISAHNLTGSAIRKKLINVLEPIQKALNVLTTP